MPGPLPLEIRERVIGAVDNGEGTMEEIAARFGVGPMTIYDWLRLREETGSLMPRQMGGARRRKRQVDEAGETWLTQRVEERGALTMKELAAQYNERFDTSVKVEVVRRTMHRLGYTFKKGLSARSPPGGPMWSRSERRSTR